MRRCTKPERWCRRRLTQRWDSRTRRGRGLAPEGGGPRCDPVRRVRLESRPLLRRAPAAGGARGELRRREPGSPARTGRWSGHGRRRTGRSSGHRGPAGRLWLRGRWRKRRQEAERIAIRVVAPGLADAEVEMRTLRRAMSARARGAEPLALIDGVATPYGDGREVQVRGVEAPVGSAHGDGQARRSRRSGERDCAACGCHHRLPNLRGDVDAAVLACCVRIVAVPVGRDHLSLHRPVPAGASGRWKHEQRRQREKEQQSRHAGTVCRGRRRVPEPSRSCRSSLRRCR